MKKSSPQPAAEINTPTETSSQTHWNEIPNRGELFELHPVKTFEYEFPTPPVVRAFDVMAHTIASGAPSCAFVGYPRFGKTWAISYSRRLLKEAFPRLPFVTLRGKNVLRPHPAHFCRQLLTQNSYEGPALKRVENPDEPVVRTWYSLAQSHRSSTLVLLGDEIQNLGEHEFSWLMDISNDLQSMGVRLVSILFGQPKLAAFRTGLLHNSRGDLLGRFMSRMFRFDGIASATELHRVFSCYDDPEEGDYPEGSGWCFTRFFVPKAYERGWRLDPHAGLCWDLFKKHAALRLQTSPNAPNLKIGMQWIASTVQHVLMYYGDNDHPQFAVSAKQWDEAIERSGFDESLGLTYDPQWTNEL